ncbi:hypothetical protein [Haloarcula japonica]|uniref:hypothetical protein n=1 Tax=Haloarcula japonica TaxID=29282 RepID=UPI000ABB7013|nr:hypothetical protein [Haloarcula japonica]
MSSRRSRTERTNAPDASRPVPMFGATAYRGSAAPAREPSAAERSPRIEATNHR